LLGSWKVVQDTKWIRKLEFAPKTHKGQSFKHSKLDLSINEIEKLIEEVMANGKIHEEGKADHAQTIPHLSQSLHRSKELVKKQKTIYET